MQGITAFTDCDSNSLVLRLPYELVIEILKSLPNVEGRDELFEKVRRAATRSNKLTVLLKEYDEYELHEASGRDAWS